MTIKAGGLAACCGHRRGWRMGRATAHPDARSRPLVVDASRADDDGACSPPLTFSPASKRGTPPPAFPPPPASPTPRGGGRPGRPTPPARPPPSPSTWGDGGKGGARGNPGTHWPFLLGDRRRGPTSSCLASALAIKGAGVGRGGKGNGDRGGKPCCPFRACATKCRDGRCWSSVSGTPASIGGGFLAQIGKAGGKGQAAEREASAASDTTTIQIYRGRSRGRFCGGWLWGDRPTLPSGVHSQLNSYAYNST